MANRLIDNMKYVTPKCTNTCKHQAFLVFLTCFVQHFTMRPLLFDRFVFARWQINRYHNFLNIISPNYTCADRVCTWKNILVNISVNRLRFGYSVAVNRLQILLLVRLLGHKYDKITTYHHA